MEKQIKTLQYDLDGQPVKITVKRASVRVGLQRQSAMAKASELIDKEETDMSEAEKMLYFFLYPTIVCSTDTVVGMAWPMSIDEFMELPDVLVSRWSTLAQEVNPHWWGDPDPEPVKEKKEKPSKRT